MKRKNKTLLILIIVFVIVTVAGGIYTFAIQGKELNEKEEKLVHLRANYASIEVLNTQLKEVEEKVLSFKLQAGESIGGERGDKDYGAYDHQSIKKTVEEIDRKITFCPG